MAVAECLPSPDWHGVELRRVSLELAGEAARIASEMGGEAAALLIGGEVAPLADRLAHHGASTVLLAEAPELREYSTETYAWVVARAIETYRPWAVLLPATSFGRDLAPRVAARLGLGLTADCIGLEIDSGNGLLLQLKPAFGGQVVAPITSSTLPSMTTLRPGMMPRYIPDMARQAALVRLDLDGLSAPRTRITATIYEGDAGLSLDDARLVVCVGMGIGGPQALEEISRVAYALGEWMGVSPEQVAIGGTRKVIDEGWLPGYQQIGITGRVVAPDLYLAIGVSGKFNHLTGILRSGIIAAVNSDPDAPIFEAADIGVVVGWQEFAPALATALDIPY